MGTCSVLTAQANEPWQPDPVQSTPLRNSLVSPFRFWAGNGLYRTPYVNPKVSYGPTPAKRSYFKEYLDTGAKCAIIE